MLKEDKDFKSRYSQWGMLLASQDGVVGLQLVLFKEFFSTSDLDVEEGISHAEERVRRGGHDGGNDET